MTEIRTIREDEGEAYLEFICEVFELDYDRAEPIFFNEPMFDLDRKWALFEGTRMVSILATSPLQFGWGRAIGIAGVATRKAERREGYASKLIERVLRESDKRGEGPALLFAQKLELYESLGFEPIDRVVQAPIIVDHKTSDEEMLSPGQVRPLYDAWAEADMSRLRRDHRRWNYWKWHNRTSLAVGDGYLCYENELLREAVVTPGMKSLPLPSATEWFGLSVMADLLELPILVPRVELVLMGRNFPGVPQFFLTDQF